MVLSLFLWSFLVTSVFPWLLALSFWRVAWLVAMAALVPIGSLLGLFFYHYPDAWLWQWFGSNLQDPVVASFLVGLPSIEWIIFGTCPLPIWLLLSRLGPAINSAWSLVPCGMGIFFNLFLFWLTSHHSTPPFYHKIGWLLRFLVLVLYFLMTCRCTRMAWAIQAVPVISCPGLLCSSSGSLSPCLLHGLPLGQCTCRLGQRVLLAVGGIGPCLA